MQQIKEGIGKIEDKEKYVRWFSSLSKEDVNLVGGKGANLGEMYNLGLPVPQGFAITAEAYSYFLEETELKEKIYSLLEKIDVENTKQLEDASKNIREMIEKAEMPEDLKEEIAEAYSSLGINKDALRNASQNVLSILKISEPVFVAVRSSATAEDSSKASFAGQQETFLNVKGKENLIENVKKCFASLFTARSIYYRVKKNFRHEDVLIAVIVQVMVNSDKSGVIFSKDPVEDKENVMIEAVFGLGEGIVSGRIQPDNYLVSKELKIIKKKIAEKKIAITRDSSGNTAAIKLVDERSNQQVLNNSEIKKLADYALKLEEHYKLAQDIEFAIDSGNIYIVQTRPITTLHLEQEKSGKEIIGKEILSGIPASPGIASGEVKIVKNLTDLEEIKKGDILVTEMTNPDMVVSMQKSSAIVTNEGGQTCHAAIVSREMGIPAVVGTKKATKILENNQVITVDGFNGKIYEGRTEKEERVEIKPITDTKTKIKVIVDLPDFAFRAAETGCKEVGLLRLEGIIAEQKKHPDYFLKNQKINEYEELIFKGIEKISEYFSSLWVRTSDIRSDEYQNLDSSPKIEANPMLGMHGIRFSLKHKEILKAEISAMKKLSLEGKKIGIMLPQVISINEVREVKNILKELNADLDLGVMIETPASIQIIEDLCKEGIKFISFGTNDLTQYTLAIDRGNEQVQYLYDETNPAVLSQLRYAIETCKKYNIETSICGQAASRKEMVEFLVMQGIDSISVNADKAFEISVFVKELEEKNMRVEQVKVKEDKEKSPEAELIKESSGEKKKKTKILTKVNCSDCGKETEVPFKPDGIRPVYCRECLIKNREKNRRENKQEDEEKERKKDNNEEEIKEEIKEEMGVEEIKKGEVFYEPESEEIIENLEYKQKEQEEIKEEAKKKPEEVEEEKNEIILDIF